MCLLWDIGYWLSKVFHEKKATGVIAKTIKKNFGDRPILPFNTAPRATQYKKSSELVVYSPDNIFKEKKRVRNKNCVFSANKALSMIIDLKLDDDDYQYLRI